MIQRRRKICFRLTDAEEQRYLPFVQAGWENSWSRVIRTALREFWERKQKQESDNIARQNELALSDTGSAVGHAPDGASSKAKKGRKTLKK